MLLPASPCSFRLFVLGGIVNELLINVSLFVLLGLGLNIVVGYAGMLDLGYVAFFAVGAYGTAILTSPLSQTIKPELSWWVALPIVMAIAALAGLIVGTPVLRMRGDYLAIVTLGFGEIVRILLLSDWLTPIFGGAQGVRQIPGIPFFGTTISGVDPQFFIYFTLIFVAIAAYISYRTQNSRVGRSWAAMREDQDVAEATGISIVQAKLLAFITGAVVASFAGALFAAKVGVIFTQSFDVLVSIIILVVVIVGGMGSIPGVAVGAFVLIGILGGPKSQGLLAEFAQYKLLIYGALLVYMMLKRPQGLIPSIRRSRELHLGEFRTGRLARQGRRLQQRRVSGGDHLMALLQINGLKIAFGGVQALGGVDFHIDQGEIVSVIGPNGAGKTSFFNVISGMFSPDEGEIIFDGDHLAHHLPNEITQRGIARTFQNVRLFPNLTVLENVMVGQHCRTKEGMWGTILQTKSQRAEEKLIEEKAKDVLFLLRFAASRISVGSTSVCALIRKPTTS